MRGLKGRTIQVKVVPDENLPPGEFSPQEIQISADTIDKVVEGAERVLERVVRAALIYMAADTARKVIVELAKK